MHDPQLFENELLREQKPLDEAARLLEGYLLAILKDAKVFMHGVATRVKDVDSATRKQRKKKYANPWEEMTDLVGARVFTYFRPDSLRVEDVLRKYFSVDEENSSNKFDKLKFNTFGYTSRHLICATSEHTRDLHLTSSRLGGMKFEVQIRTLLEHAWAEIEHELVYKAGTIPLKTTRRRFAASAASLEIVEREFDALRRAEFELIEERAKRVGRSRRAALDRGWMMAALHAVYPDRPGWDPEPTKDVFFHGIELQLLEQLRDVDCKTVGKFIRILRDRRVGAMVAAYAGSRGIGADQVSHLPVTLFAAAVLTDGELPEPLKRLLDSDAGAAIAAGLAL